MRNEFFRQAMSTQPTEHPTEYPREPQKSPSPKPGDEAHIPKPR